MMYIRQCCICGDFENPDYSVATVDDTWICESCCKMIRRILSDEFNVNLVKAYDQRTPKGWSDEMRILP